VDRVNRRAIFLDRDGTLNVRPPEHEYLTSSEDFAWIPGAREAVGKFGQAGYVLTLVSNQRGVGRGLVSLDVLREIEQRIQRDLALDGCSIQSFRYCFHSDEDGCDCRKPRPGMILDLADELDLDLAESWVIGDAASDVAAGRAAGCRTALVGGGRADGADLLAASLADASNAIAGGVQAASGAARSNSSTSA
jgi:D-glycero-D-manno-heptose 1,7-bisphosphate phosphatase